MHKNTHTIIKEFYGHAAQKPQADLCCPVSYPSEDISHIPEEVIERFYGCGSPVSIAGIVDGESVLDLGSGAGIDCFIASKKVGVRGNVTGIDMTDEMLKIANKSKEKVNNSLGYNNIDFKKGYLEDIPVDDKSNDLVTSNCVINLSPNKVKVFNEIWRVLKNHGRLVISDIISEKELPPHIKDDTELWGECLAGSITENELLSIIEKTGFYGIEILNKNFWKSIENIDFHSITLRAYKFEKSPTCNYQGHRAIYNGPFKVIIDDEGHVFTRNQVIEVCIDTVNKLMNMPYKGNFTIIKPTGEITDDSCSTTGCC